MQGIQEEAVSAQIVLADTRARGIMDAVTAGDTGMCQPPSGTSEEAAKAFLRTRPTEPPRCWLGAALAHSPRGAYGPGAPCLTVEGNPHANP